MTHEQLIALVTDIRAILWPPDEPGKSWDPDTLDEIAYSMGISRVDGPEKPQA